MLALPGHTSEQRTGSRTQKQPLDRKRPIQVVCEPGSRDYGWEINAGDRLNATFGEESDDRPRMASRRCLRSGSVGRGARLERRRYCLARANRKSWGRYADGVGVK